MTELEERRQRAREATYDNASGSRFEEVVEVAIETATRVRVDDTLIDDLADVAFAGGFETRRALIVAAFRAAGFEVEE